jgi:hypothetical protein
MQKISFKIWGILWWLVTPQPAVKKLKMHYENVSEKEPISADDDARKRAFH